jgi:hypothetical protein
MKDFAGQRNFEERERVFRAHLRAQLLMPVRAELRAPQTLLAVATFARTDLEIRQLADTQSRRAVFERELH